MTNKVWKRTGLLPGWEFQHVNAPPFRGIWTRCHNRGEHIYSASAYSTGLNPENMLYYLVDDILGVIGAQECEAESGPKLARSADQSTAINKQVFWIPIDDPVDPCPVNTKVQLIHKADGNAMYGLYTPGDKRWTHWQGAPVFKD